MKVYVRGGKKKLEMKNGEKLGRGGDGVKTKDC